ncbi:hypothetical protein AGLY_000263 [Aphis glycines]|uniref:Uncharacterized protein n=1 Tax=Aphis glycines TaxID=307491 RepID=A0A6G0U6H1_APHGL|nr:hypothetical protein AGLY_000263 [Aphis glycines]
MLDYMSTKRKTRPYCKHYFIRLSINKAAIISHIARFLYIILLLRHIRTSIGSAPVGGWPRAHNYDHARRSSSPSSVGRSKWERRKNEKKSLKCICSRPSRWRPDGCGHISRETIRKSATGNDVTSAHKPHPPPPSPQSNCAIHEYATALRIIIFFNNCSFVHRPQRSGRVISYTRYCRSPSSSRQRFLARRPQSKLSNRIRLPVRVHTSAVLRR